MEKALQNIKRLLGEKTAQSWRGRLERIRQMPSSMQKFKRLATASDKEQLGDYLAEIRYALVFAGLGFEIEAEPLGEEGPDFRITKDNHSAFLEVTRFRTTQPGPPPISLSDKEFSDETFLLEEYGNLTRDVVKAFRKIVKKLRRQVGDKESIIAIWDDEVDLDLAIEQVPPFLHEAVRQIPSPPKGLFFILYGSSSNRIEDRKQPHCYPSRTPLEPHQETWKKELENVYFD